MGVRPYVTLDDVHSSRVDLNETHIANLKVLLLSAVRAEWKKRRINLLSQYSLRHIPSHWTFSRILFYPNGECEYVAGQDYPTELREAVTAIIGKKPN